MLDSKVMLHSRFSLSKPAADLRQNFQDEAKRDTPPQSDDKIKL